MSSETEGRQLEELKADKPGKLVYEQAQHAILKLIEQRSYIAGDRIPSERDLSDRFGVHRMTVRKAIDKLVHEGMLERRGTSGTYIPAPVVMRPVSGHSFSQSISEIVRNSGGSPGSKLLFFERGEASLRAAEKLTVGVGEPLLIIKRLRTIDELPFCAETTWLPAKLVPGLTADDLFGDLSFYELLEKRYGVKPGTAKATLSSVPVPAADAEILGMKQGEQALAVHSVTSDKRGVPIEYLTSLNHPRRVMFTIE